MVCQAHKECRCSTGRCEGGRRAGTLPKYTTESYFVLSVAKLQGDLGHSKARGRGTMRSEQ